MNGKTVYVPGWDCHGLPIEWKIEEQYKKEKIKMKCQLKILKECRNLQKTGLIYTLKI